MRNVLSHPYQEEDRGLLGPAASGLHIPAPTSWKSLPLSQHDREQLEHLQQQLHDARAQRRLADAQIEEAERHLESLRKQYTTNRP